MLLIDEPVLTVDKSQRQRRESALNADEKIDSDELDE
jgi:hypothetical protein